MNTMDDLLEKENELKRLAIEHKNLTERMFFLIQNMDTVDGLSRLNAYHSIFREFSQKLEYTLESLEMSRTRCLYAPPDILMEKSFRSLTERMKASKYDEFI